MTPDFLKISFMCNACIFVENFSYKNKAFGYWARACHMCNINNDIIVAELHHQYIDIIVKWCQYIENVAKRCQSMVIVKNVSTLILFFTY